MTLRIPGLGETVQLPETFRTHLPPRVVDSGRIFRDIEGLESIFQTKGSGAGPEMLRTEMGVMYGFDLADLLAAQLVDLDVAAVAASPGAANTTASQAFSFPTMLDGSPCARHRILASSVTFSVADVANFAGGRLDGTVFGDPSTMILGWVETGDVINLGGLGTFSPLVGMPNDLWGDRETEYIWNARSGAGGATTTNLELLVMLVPPGLTVPL